MDDGQVLRRHKDQLWCHLLPIPHETQPSVPAANLLEQLLLMPLVDFRTNEETLPDSNPVATLWQHPEAPPAAVA